MLNPQIKKTIINALMKVIDSAPNMPNKQYNSYMSNYYPQDLYQTKETYGHKYTYQSDMIYPSNNVTNESFEIWINYVFSVLKITAQQIDSNISYDVYQQIKTIVSQNNEDNSSKTINICRIILNYAQNILNM